MPKKRPVSEAVVADIARVSGFSGTGVASAPMPSGSKLIVQQFMMVAPKFVDFLCKSHGGSWELDQNHLSGVGAEKVFFKFVPEDLDDEKVASFNLVLEYFPEDETYNALAAYKANGQVVAKKRFHRIPARYIWDPAKMFGPIVAQLAPVEEEADYEILWYMRLLSGIEGNISLKELKVEGSCSSKRKRAI